MDPSGCWANFLIARSRIEKEEEEMARRNHFDQLNQQLIEEQIKETRLRNELLQASLDKVKRS